MNHISLCLSVVMTENDIFRALADPTRRAIFEKLADGAQNASALREGIGISQLTMSQHLAVLRGRGWSSNGGRVVSSITRSIRMG